MPHIHNKLSHNAFVKRTMIINQENIRGFRYKSNGIPYILCSLMCHDIFPDNGARLHMASCTEQEAEIYMPFCHREYNENEKLAKERFHVHERIWGDEKSWEDPDYPFDWTEGEFCLRS